MAFTKIKNSDLTDKGVIGLSDTPQLSTSAMQAKFEETARSVIIPKHNALIDELEASTGASSIGTTNGNVQSDINAISAIAGAYTSDINALKAEDITIKANITALQTDKHTHTNKALLDTYSQTETDLSSAVSQKHTHSNKTVIDALSKDSDGDLNFEGQKIKGGSTGASSWSELTNKPFNSIDNDTVYSSNGVLKAKQMVVDNALSSTSENPVQNKVIKQALDNVEIDVDNALSTTSTNPVQNKVVTEAINNISVDAYKKVKVGDTELVADGEDEVSIVAGSNVTILADATTKSITINSIGGGGGGGVSDYSALTGKPKINNVELSGNKTSSDLGLADSDDIPTKTSDLTNDSNFVSDNSYVHTDNNYTDSDKSAVGNIANKVDKVDGKGLSTVDFTDTNYVHTDNNYTTTEKTKLSGLKSVSWTQNTTSGTKIAEINIGGTTTDVYAPTSGGGGGTSDYNDLSNKPSINGVSLSGNKTSSDLGIDIPTALSDLTDDSAHRLVTDAEKTSWSWPNRYTDSVISTMTTGYNSTLLHNEIFKDVDNKTIEFFVEPTLNTSGDYEYLTLESYKINTTTGNISMRFSETPTVDIRFRIDITTYR